MQLLEPGSYLGTTRSRSYHNGIWVGITRYAAENLPDSSLHAHVNPHLTLLLRGATRERRGFRHYDRLAGQTVFFHSQEPHQNDRTLVGSQNLNLEFDPRFFQRAGLREADVQLAIEQNVGPSTLLLKAYQELLTDDAFSADSVLMTLLAAFAWRAKKQPEPAASWLGTVKELLHDRWNETVTLPELAAATGRHPVTVSRQFHQHLGCTLGEYMRRLKVERALPLIHEPSRTLTDVAYACGFADQSHFTRSFRKLTGFSPREYKKF